MLLCDIGNSFAKFYDGKRLERLKVEEISKYANERVFYINVNERIAKRVQSFSCWLNLAPFIHFDTPYKGMGVDRQVLCLVVDDGVVVDAGSAITVDVMENKKHKGGFIMPGIRFLLEDFGAISSKLEIKEVEPIDIQKLPLNTKQALHYGIIAPIVLAIEQFDKRVYITGGDGKILAKYFFNSIYDELMIFKGMMKIVKRNSLC